MTIPDPNDGSQPKPLRIIAAVASLVTLIVGGLPAFGVALTATQIGIISGVIGAIGIIAVVLVGEPQVTPVTSPRDNDGNRLVVEGSVTGVVPHHVHED